MDTKFSLVATSDEVRALLMARIERSLRESGVELTEDARTRIAACLPVPEIGGHVEAAPNGNQRHYRPTIQEAHAVLDRAQVAPATTSGKDSRARAYRPTPRAHEVPHAVSTRDKVLNLIVRSQVCTLGDLTTGTRRPKKAIYTALWSLKKDHLIDITPLSALEPTTQKH